MKYVFLTEEELVAILRRERGGSQPPVPSLPPKVSKPLANTKQLCDFAKITEPTVIRWRNKGKIPFFKIGSVYRYDLDAVAAALSNPKKGEKR